jgi:hypothetical protein
MDKPASKQELLKSIHVERQRLEDALKGISASDMVKSSRPDHWSTKDLLAHIAAWEKKLLKWYETGLRGEKQTMPQWNTPGLIDEINLKIYQRNRDRELPEVLKEFKESYKHIFEVVTSIPEADMFAHGKYEWTGEGTLADYIVANTSRHYAEHQATVETIKKKR